MRRKNRMSIRGSYSEMWLPGSESNRKGWLEWGKGPVGRRPFLLGKRTVYRNSLFSLWIRSLFCRRLQSVCQYKKVKRDGHARGQNRWDWNGVERNLQAVSSPENKWVLSGNRIFLKWFRCVLCITVLYTSKYFYLSAWCFRACFYEKAKALYVLFKLGVMNCFLMCKSVARWWHFRHFMVLRGKILRRWR